MSGLPRVPSTRRRRAVWEIMILGAIERLTDELMSGREFSEADLADMHDLRRRLHGFDNALAAREQQAGVIENFTE